MTKAQFFCTTACRTLEQATGKLHLHFVSDFDISRDVSCAFLAILYHQPFQIEGDFSKSMPEAKQKATAPDRRMQ